MPLLDQPVTFPFEEPGSTRRTFLKLAGFGIAATALPGCSRAPAAKLAGWVQAQDGVVGGKSYSIATTCDGCAAGCGVLATCRDGRPIKLEGNPAHPLSKGGLCAVGQASVLALYDALRFDGPRLRGAPVGWEAADAAALAALAEAAARGGRIRLLTDTIASPSTRHWIDSFARRFPGARHVAYDALGGSAILDAHERTHGARVLPRYRFERAALIASFDADFLGTWISPVEFAHGWAAGRRPEAGEMSRHWQFEARMSLTGGCADERIRMAPWETGPAVLALRDAVVDGTPPPAGAPARAALATLAAALVRAPGRCLVVAGSNDPAIQVLVNEINHALGSYGRTLDVERPSRQRQGSDRALTDLLAELEGGGVDVLIVRGANPAYDLPRGAVNAVRAAKLLVATAPLRDETADLADVVLPEPHFLESWNDAEPVAGTFGLTQPTVPPLRSTRTLRETLARWCGDARTDRELVATYWRDQVHPRFADGGPFQRFLRKALHDGFVTVDRGPAPGTSFRVPPPAPAAATPRPAAGELALVLYPKVALLDGRHAQNPWLQELPDPVSRIAWESYATLAPDAARSIGLVEGDVVLVDAGQGAPKLELPVHVEPGQHDGVLGVALGYGRVGTDRFSGVGPEWLEGLLTVEKGGVVGRNAAPWLVLGPSGLSFDGRCVRIARTGARADLAGVQEHRSLEVPSTLGPAAHEARDVVRTATLEAYRRAGPEAFPRTHVPPAAGLWPTERGDGGPRWAMVVDLSACTGCSSCVIACQAENNVPVVGRDEVRRHREMSWIRIDRYATGGPDRLTVSRQPMMCQHCGNAPCESVCPVLATVHGADGLNHQVYNRCVGTRYCANTCPYKVRRFNWFDYARDDALANDALNPDVTVRTRGVMEKCSMCLQRIEEGRLEARRRGEPVADGAIQTACQQSCPTGAIVFGDLSDAASAVSRLVRSGRGYRVLEELNVDPRVSYLAWIRNPEPPA
jgi:molybdopterin-containing oxidoreductase family iron-sulfur binding subunit